MQEQSLAEITQALSIAELKQFGKQTGPLVTILAPSKAPGRQNKALDLRLKRLAHEAEQKLADRGADSASMVMEPLLAQIANIGDDAKGESVALFAAPGETRVYWLPGHYDEVVALGENFLIRPLLSLINRDKEFYILAVAQKHT